MAIETNRVHSEWLRRANAKPRECNDRDYENIEKLSKTTRESDIKYRNIFFGMTAVLAIAYVATYIAAFLQNSEEAADYTFLASMGIGVAAAIPCQIGAYFDNKLSLEKEYLKHPEEPISRSVELRELNKQGE